ncbi:g7897 [Coccomyxa viridis]|uniref:G7897 protein n=1 Tax=Coccomyxa viridis TaxID=1274662 RepID=A0ABP1G1H3_9CHLO
MSDALAVSQSKLYRWQRAPLLMARPLDRSHLRRKTTTAIGDAVICWVTRHIFATLDAIREHLRSSLSVLPSKQSISRMLRERNWTRKRGSKAYTEADASRGAQFSRSIAAGLSSRTLALDECAFFLNHSRHYAWSPRGTRAVVRRPGRRGRAYSLLLCIGHSGYTSWSLFEGAVTGKRFQDFLNRLPRGSDLILDNAAIHRAARVLRLQGVPTISDTADAQGIGLRYLPPYTPQLNPVELASNTIRQLVNLGQPRDPVALERCIAEAIARLTPLVCSATFRKCFPATS